MYGYTNEQNQNPRKRNSWSDDSVDDTTHKRRGLQTKDYRPFLVSFLQSDHATIVLTELLKVWSSSLFIPCIPEIFLRCTNNSSNVLNSRVYILTSSARTTKAHGTKVSHTGSVFRFSRSIQTCFLTKNVKQITCYHTTVVSLIEHLERNSAKLKTSQGPTISVIAQEVIYQSGVNFFVSFLTHRKRVTNNHLSPLSKKNSKYRLVTIR